MEIQSSHKTVPTWFWIVAGLGLLWNVFGVMQFLQSLSATKESLMTMGMTDAQAQTMSNYPVWMTVAFAVGTFGGLLGSILLLLKKKLATKVFVLSLIGYIVLYIGDITEGIFAAIGSSQVIILTAVVLIAAGLQWLSRTFERRNILK